MTNQEIQEFTKVMNSAFFAKLDLEIPFDTMLAELQDFQKRNTLELVPFSTGRDETFNLDVLGIIDLTSNPQEAGGYIANNWKKGLAGVQKTSLYEYFPKTTSWIFENIPGVFRCKISKLPAGKSADWHNHPHHLTHFDAVLHIPLISNPAVTMNVRYTDDHNTEKSHYFSPGNIWYFNSSAEVDHSVTNDSDQDRWHLWINALVVDKYNNPWNRELVNSMLRSEKINGK